MEISVCTLSMSFLAGVLLCLLLITCFTAALPLLKYLRDKVAKRTFFTPNRRIPRWVYSSVVTAVVIFVLFMGVQKPIKIVPCDQGQGNSVVTSTSTYGTLDTCYSENFKTYLF